MRPTKIAEGIYSVGVIDWNIRDFHGYSTDRGSSYNAFLIIDEKIALIDTVKKEFADQLIKNICDIIDPKKIDYLISNHTEMDHSGSLPPVMRAIGENKPLYCSKMGLKNIQRHFPQKWNFHAVENGEELCLGNKTLQFIETKMLHWPDSMFSYLKEDKILFSSDAFGQHYAGYEIFNDQVGEAIMPHAKKYFANILLLYAPRILKLVDQIAELGLKFEMICPDHGVLWRNNPSEIIDAYVKWSRQEGEKKAVVVYDTMWHSTETMAEAISSSIAEEGVAACPINIRNSHRSDIVTAVLDAKAVIVGSPTLNNGLFPTVSDFLTYMKGLKPQNKIAAAFGSYGWSGEAVDLINKEFESMKLEILDPGLKIQYVPDNEAMDACFQFGKKIAKAVSR
ncbi:MAG: FprA family A-type flavoprotein [Desulfobacterales bacterium]|nr:FprA family A-type flavoprotein [Desulfobacterales bacterium]